MHYLSLLLDTLEKLRQIYHTIPYTIKFPLTIIYYLTGLRLPFCPKVNVNINLYTIRTLNLYKLYRPFFVGN